MNHNLPVATFKLQKYILNIYIYQQSLVGIIEDPHYLQLFEMNKYGTVQEYFDWRHSCHRFKCLLNVSGKPIFSNVDHDEYETLQESMLNTSIEISIPLREFS